MSSDHLMGRGRALFGLGFVFATLLGCNRSHEGASATTEASPEASSNGITTPWVAARAAKDLSLLEAPAKLLVSPGTNAAISAPFTSRILAIRVSPGQHVKKGDPIVSVLAPEVVRASGAERAASLRLDAYQKRKAQLEALRADGLVRLGDVADVDAKIAEAKGELAIAGATLRSASSLGAQISGDTLSLVSPVDGVVTDVTAVLGEVREPSQGPFAHVAGIGPVRIEARFSQRPPQGAAYTFFGAPGFSSRLHVIGEAPLLDTDDGALRVWLEPDSPFDLPAGTLGKVRASLPDEKGIVAVPTAALGLEGGKAFVVLEKTRRPAPVEVLATSGADAIVRGDLEVGDRVAADASMARSGDSL